MTLAAGTTIGPYRLDEPLGHGGMGSVYRATDTRLDRTVAVKFLSDEIADGPTRRRFQREAQLASALNHPHIVTVHDVGEIDGRQYLVTEYIDGGTLRDWMQEPHGWRATIDIAIGIADALAVAHEAGILHRDIKPENILLTRSGRAKLADFGLAKLHAPPAAVTQTATDLYTRPGAILGTAAYMSPEQALGGAVDERSDVFSFAIVLYELLAGRRPFAGRTELDVLHAIVHAPAMPLPAAVPSPLRRLVETALEKEPVKRVQTMRAVVTELQRIGQAADPPQARGRRGTLAITGAIATMAALMAALAFVLERQPPTRAPLEYEQLTNFADSATSPALSPDGNLLAFIRGPSPFFGPGQIYVKRLPDGDAIQLTNDATQKMGPQFTPDGTYVSYTTDIGGDSVSMDTWIVPVGGGPPRRLMTNAEGLTWVGQDRGPARVLFSEMTGLAGQMSIVTAAGNGTDPRAVYVPPPPDGMAHRSYRSPDGRWVLIVEMDLHSWLACRLVPFDRSSNGRTVGPVPSQCTDAAWSQDGKWMYFTATNAGGVHIWRQAFPDGTPEQVTSGAFSEDGVQVAPDGRSFVTSVGTSQNLLWVHDARGDRQITAEGFTLLPSFSPDGTKLYYLLRSFGLRSWNEGSLWVADLATGRRERLFPEFHMTQYAISRDGRRIVFVQATDGGQSPAWIAPVDGRGRPRQLTTMDTAMAFFGAPGEVIIGSTGQDIHLYAVREDGNDLRKLVAAPLMPIGVAPGGRAVTVLDATSWGALIVRGADGVTQTRLCDSCAPPWGTEPIPFYLGWSPDGSVLYWTFNDTTYAIPLEPGAILPPLPASGVQTKAVIAALPGARVVSEREGTVPGPNPSIFAYTMLSTRRNIYRVVITSSD